MRAETIGRRQDGSRIDGGNSGDRIVARATLLAFLRFRKGFDSLAILNYQFGWSYKSECQEKNLPRGSVPTLCWSRHSAPTV